MHVTYYRFLFCLVLFFIHQLVNSSFTPDTTDYDAYGLKIAMNEHFLVLAQNNHQPPTFFLQFAPYNDTQPLSSSQCSITYPNSTNTFIYTVALGKKQQPNQIQFFFAGEFTDDQSGLFIGMAKYNNTDQNSTISLTSLSCDTSFIYSIEYIYEYVHQEYYIIGVDPQGLYAYGFSNAFVFVYDSKNTSNFHIWNGSLTWPDVSFIPHGVDISDRYGVVAGFIHNSPNSTTIYSPMIYLLNFNASDSYHPMVVHQYKPIPNPNTWQDLLTNADANLYAAKYDMSVSINEQGYILVGMQFINRVFLLSVNITKPNRLTYISRCTKGRSLGNGKSIAWLDNGIAAILINVYTLNYEWSLSQIFFFDIYEGGYNSNSTPLSVYPNSHQLLPSSFSLIFLNVVSSPSSLALINDEGKIIIFSPTLSGYYPVIQDTKKSPYLTTSKTCMPGSYKNKSGIYDCILCPPGTKNAGNSNIQCISCLPEAFCPLASVEDIAQSALETILQAIPYPHSPESTIFDEILLHNMFSIGSGRCMIISPLFWALIIAGIVILIIIIMEIMHLFIKHPKSRKIRKFLQATFRHTDLIGEGEYWVSGLVSFSLVVLVSFAYAFSSEYSRQYPIETTSAPHFACDPTMRNAKFETNVQSLAIPFTEKEQEMFDLLDQQEFLLKIDFVNTLVSCDAVSIEAQFGLTWLTIRWLDCYNLNSTLTLSIPLPYQHISVHVFLDDTKTMGAIRIGLSGPGKLNGSYTLQKLEFYQSYSKNAYTLSRILPVAIAMTKVINETKPMFGEESEFSGIYIPTFTVDMNSLFVSNDQYVRSNLTLTTLTIVISETPYYVKNLQEPIAREPEIIFRNLLFTVVCLEIFGLVFLSYKLAFKPLYYKIVRNKITKKEQQKIEEKKLETTDCIIKIVEQF